MAGIVEHRCAWLALIYTNRQNLAARPGFGQLDSAVTHIVTPGLDPGVHRIKGSCEEDGLHRNSGSSELRTIKSGKPDLRCQAQQ
jgi:hypothetical protein